MRLSSSQIENKKIISECDNYKLVQKKFDITKVEMRDISQCVCVKIKQQKAQKLISNKYIL